MFRFFKITCIAGLFVLMTNFLLQYAFRQVSGDTVKKDSVLGWDFSNFKKKNFNEFGFRTPLSAKEIIESGKTPVVFMGNSVVAGDTLNYDQVFPYLINKYIDNRFLVLNAGSEGYEIYREYLKFQRDYIKVKPKYVVWFPSTNDFQNKASIFQNLIQTAEAQGSQEEKFPLNLIAGFNVTAAQIQNYKQLTNEKFLWAEKNKQYTNPLLGEFPKDVKESFIKEMQDMNAYFTKNEVKLIVVYLPPHYFCKFHQWEDALSFKELDVILKDERITTISLFNKLPCRDKTIYEDYVHFNEAGHEELAKILSIELKPHLK